MKEALFGPAMTGPIDNPRGVRIDPTEIAAALFDEKTRGRLERVAGARHFSPVELIREGTLRYLDDLENNREIERPDSLTK
jgi:hypothetical protein